MAWVVTGGAGYIGSHVAESLLNAGHRVVVLDDLSSGNEQFVPESADLVRGSILDRQALLEALAGATGPDSGVVHLAATKYAGVSVREPLHAYEINVEGTRALLAACAELGIRNFVFSSSASVYGSGAVDTVTEDSPLMPESPYGETKLIGEWLARDVSRALRLAGSATPMAQVALRYFNVVGSGSSGVRDLSPHNLFPLAIAAMVRGDAPQIHGTDYNTPDGTCVRDYIHVVDVAEAHVAAANALVAGRELPDALNLGRGEGYSVRQVLGALIAEAGLEISPLEGPRRPGDPDRIVADPAAAEATLGWRAERDLQEMVRSAWAAR